MSGNNVRKSNWGFRGRKANQCREFLAMYEWLEQNEPEALEALRIGDSSPKPRFISKHNHSKKKIRCNARQY